jgi:UDP-3-O-[3-hydroxymyristoyl] glucosamine N-acyltransferase
MFGGAAMINGHIEICDHVFVSGGTLVSSSIKTPGRYTGVFPFEENSKWEKNAATLRQLHKLRDRIRALEKKS